MNHTMTITMDRAGRLVIPKGIREQAHLVAGVPLEIRLHDGCIEIEPAPRRIAIVKRGRFRVAEPVGEPPPVLTAQTVRAIRSRLRERLG
jgi:AbrB family looped-hinge helix DNA binding protein